MKSQTHTRQKSLGRNIYDLNYSGRQGNTGAYKRLGNSNNMMGDASKSFQKSAYYEVGPLETIAWLIISRVSRSLFLYHDLSLHFSYQRPNDMTGAFPKKPLAIHN